MCQTHTQNNETPTHSHCGHDHERPDGRGDEPVNEDVTSTAPIIAGHSRDGVA
jgi:hypothetical protein